MEHCHDTGYAGKRVMAVVLLWMMLWPMMPLAVAQERTPEIDVDVISVQGDASSPLTRVDIYTRIPYTGLQFINTINGFSARYTVTLEAHRLDSDGRRQNLLQTRIWEGREQGVETYGATQSPEFYSFTTHSTSLVPGRYVFELQVEDQNTNESFVREVITEVRNLNKPVSLSGLMIGESYDAATSTISPSVSNQIDTDAVEFRLFYEIYASQPRSVTVTREIVRAELTSAVPGIDAAEPLYTDVSTLRLNGRKEQVIDQIPISTLGVGTYVVRVKVEDENGQLLDMADKAFLGRWTGLAAHLSDIDEAIAQLRVVAKPKELRHIRDGGSLNERMQRFLAFWKKRDPTPSTRRNERMEEYYYRIAFANRRYGRTINGQNNGWQTDRGDVLIRYGEPDHIQHKPFSFNAEPYEVWLYERLGLQFIFIDRTGLGDYELLHPIWDDRNRIR